jgi:hypothetical protein
MLMHVLPQQSALTDVAFGAPRQLSHKHKKQLCWPACAPYNLAGPSPATRPPHLLVPTGECQPVSSHRSSSGSHGSTATGTVTTGTSTPAAATAAAPSPAAPSHAAPTCAAATPTNTATTSCSTSRRWLPAAAQPAAIWHAADAHGRPTAARYGGQCLRVRQTVWGQLVLVGYVLGLWRVQLWSERTTPTRLK